MQIQEKEAELSYAYLHAIAGAAGMNCTISNRNEDNAGVDAMLNFRSKDLEHPYITHVALFVQLKATKKHPGELKDHMTYFFQGIKRYDTLRTEDSNIYKILIILFLPDEPDEWLKCSPSELILKNAAYWICLYGAEKSENDTGQTIYIPKKNLLTPVELQNIANLAVNKAIPPYSKPSYA